MTTDYAAARKAMVDSQVRVNDVTDWALQDALSVVPREAHVMAGRQHLAYADDEVEFAPGRFLLRPRDVAKLLQALEPKTGEKALAIDAPYAAAVLEVLGLKVDQASANAVAGFGYDVVVCEGAVESALDVWIDLLAPGGRLGVVERRGKAGKAVVYLRGEQSTASRVAFDCHAPYVPGFEPKPAFNF